MNNPYRARPGRPRVDHNAPSYAMQNQKPLPPTIYQNQNPVAAQTGDSWEWGDTDNGNDAWNWSVEQSTESQSQLSLQQQQQHLQQRQQQAQYASSHANMRLAQQKPMQENFYTNLNGNNRPQVPLQAPGSGANTPRTSLSRESTPSASENFPHYQNYPVNAPPMAGRMPPTPMPPKPQNPAQWQTNTERKDSGVFPISANTYFQPGPTFEAANPAVAPEKQPNYEWNVAQNVAPPPKAWANQAQDGGFWQESSSESSQQFETSWAQETPTWQRDPEAEHARVTSEAQTPAWHEENQGINHQVANSFANNPQNVAQTWPYAAPMQPAWIKPETPRVADTPPIETGLTNRNWQHPEPIVNYSQSGIIPTPSSASLASSSDEKSPSVAASVENTYSIQSPAVSEDQSTAVSPLAAQPDENYERNQAGEPLEVVQSPENNLKHVEGAQSDLATSVGQLSLDDAASAHARNLFSFQSPPPAVNMWPRQYNNQNSRPQNHANFPQHPVMSYPQELEAPRAQEPSVPGLNVATQPLQHSEQPAVQFTPPAVAKPLEITAEVVQNPEQQPAVAETVSAPAENISQTGYDQWYNRNASDRYERQPQRQWPSIELENYEPQAPLDFVNVDQPAAVEVTEDSAGKVPPADVKLHPPSVRNVEASSHVELDSYEFASNDRNTFLETGELTDSHHEHESTPLSQDDENDEVPSDIPFPREVPGQSSSADPRRNAPTGEEQYVQRVVDPRRNDPPPQTLLSERRDVPPGQERRDTPQLTARDSEMLDRRGRSLPQSRNDPSGEERAQLPAEPEVREIPGRIVETSDSTSRQIPGGVSAEVPADDTRIVTGSRQTPVASGDAADTRNKREEALGASTRVNQLPGSPKRRDSYEDGDDEESGNSREENRDRRRDVSPERRRYDYDRKDRGYYDREYEDDYYYERRRGPDYERSYNSREDLGRDSSFRDGDRNHARDEMDERRRLRDDDDRRRRDERKGFRMDDPRRRDGKEFDGRYRDRDFMEKDRRDERRRRYDEYDPRDPRREYYDDPYARGSRPSSRSSYNDREYYMRFRDPFYGYNNGYGGYDYGGNYNANYYAYLENLRRTDPVAYAAWYNKYYGGQQQQQQQSVARTNYPEDRASVHSGQSSCEDRTSGKQTIGEISMQEDSRIPSRLTPTKFSTSHVKGSFSIGSLVQVHASYPADGERARVDILRVESLLAHDSVARELRAYPGPLIKGVTHKKTIIEYCEGKIKKASTNSELVDPASYILLYQLMIMLIQQNGNVVGVDIASLLLRNKETYPYDENQLKPDLNRRELNSQKSSTKDGSQSDSPASEMPPKTLQQITNEFRNTLLCGLVQEALEYAMEEGLWGHALFLASKLDKRTHASVMTRFANSLPVQDPLQTLYQLHSGRVPASVTCVADAKWDDWRPHLAMIISNTSTNPEINRRAITTLGDTLHTRGDIYAAHFCYILAQVDFGTYGTTGVKLALIGANHNKIYSEFATPEAVMLTEIYEYARKLSEPGFTLVGLQTFKLEAAQKMVDYGLVEKSLLYLEQIAINIVNNPGKYRETFIQDVYTLSERIKFHDPVFKDCTDDDTSALAWLSRLGEILGRCQAGEIVQDLRGDTQSVMQELETRETPQQWGNSVQQEFNAEPVSLMEVPVNSHDQWQPLSLPATQDHYGESNQFAQSAVEGSQYQQQDYWGQQRYPDYGNDWQTQQGQFQQEQETDSSQARWNYEPAPQISMAPSAGKQYDPLKELDVLEGPNEATKPAETSKKSQDKLGDKKATNSGGSWLGGWFSKLTPKPKNQMILPDDNNPTIVWDPVTKRWTNKDENGEGGSSQVAPPPKASELGLKPIIEPPSVPENIPNPPREDSASLNTTKMISGSNMFKLQKSRGMRSNYIDVMNPGGGKNTSIAPTPVNSPLAPMAASSPQLFVPPPVNDPNAPVDFLTPVPVNSVNSEPNSQGGPTMYDPSETNDVSTNHVLRGRYPPR